MQSHTDTSRSGEYLLSQSLGLLAATAAVLEASTAVIEILLEQA